MIKAVIFDVDRTLVDSMKVEFNSFSKAYFKLKGKYVPKDILDNLSNNPTSITYKLLKLTDDEIKLLNHYWDIYLKKEKINFFEGIRELLEDLKTMKIKLGIFTSRNLGEFYELDNLFKDIIDIFDIIITVDKVKYPKPNPEGLNLIKKTLGLESREIIYVGDHYNDMKCAEDAFVYFFHAKWDENIENLDTKYVFDSPSKVLSTIKHQFQKNI